MCPLPSSIVSRAARKAVVFLLTRIACCRSSMTLGGKSRVTAELDLNEAVSRRSSPERREAAGTVLSGNLKLRRAASRPFFQRTYQNRIKTPSEVPEGVSPLSESRLPKLLKIQSTEWNL